MVAVPIPRQVIDGDAVLAEIQCTLYFNQVVNGTLSICWEVWEFTRVRYLSCRCYYITRFHFLVLSTSEFSMHSTFTPGQKYYTTVRACNGVGLCQKRCSDGIIMDNSPPIPGVVFVGHRERHQHYLGHKYIILYIIIEKLEFNLGVL